MTMIVHALRHGFALCRFSDFVPRDWPDGHVWTNVGDTEHITCAECKARAEAIVAGSATEGWTTHDQLKDHR